MSTVLIALAASGCWGVADFTGGLLSRRLPVVVVLAVIEVTGLAIGVVLLVARAESLPATEPLLLGVFAGVVGSIALGCFYRALAIGTVSIVAPISATGVALPVVVSLATGDRPSAPVAIGLAATVVGVLLAAREHHDDAVAARAGRAAVGLALIAALGFGSYFVLADSAADASILWLLVCSRIVIVPALLVIALARHAPGPRGHSWAWLIAAGTLDMSATGLYAVANTRGALSIVSVVGSLYPVATVLLARAILHERIGRLQQVGVITAIVGVALIASGAA